MVNLKGRDFLKLLDFSTEEIVYLLDLAAKLKRDKKEKKEKRYLEGKNVVLLFEKDSTRTRCAFEVAAFDQGAHATYLGPSGSQIGKKESMADTARVLSGMYDGIEYRGYGQYIVEELARYASVPVWNGLTNEYHPTQVLADLLTMRESCPKPLNNITFAYLGDARYNMGNSLMIGAAKMGMNFRSVAPEGSRTDPHITTLCQAIAAETGAKITVTGDVAEGVKDCDFIYTDVWVSMGEPESVWQERIERLLPYRVTSEVMRMTGNPNCKFLHCLPSFHNRETAMGEQIYQKYGIDCMEVDDSVFESAANLAFEEAANRLHTIKAVMVATLGEGL